MDSKFGFIIGNGESRRGFDLEGLRKFNAPIYGCNALYRDFKPDILSIQDRRMVKMVSDDNYDGVTAFGLSNNACWVSGKGVVGKIYEFNNMMNGGFMMIRLMTIFHSDITDIFLLGFDPYGSKEKFKGRNNIYKHLSPYILPPDAVKKYIPDFKGWDSEDGVKFLVGLGKSAFCCLPEECPNVNFYRVDNKNPNNLTIKNWKWITYGQMDEML